MHQYVTNLSEGVSSVHVETAKGTEKKTLQSNETGKSPKIVDITKEQSFWDKAVLS